MQTVIREFRTVFVPDYQMIDMPGVYFLKGCLSFSQYPKPKFSADGKYFINLLPKDEGSAGYFRHVAKVTTEVGE